MSNPLPNPLGADQDALAFARCEPKLKALPSQGLRKPNQDLGVASTRVSGTLQQLEARGLRPDFAKLDGARWSIEHLDNLQDLARAAQHIHHQRERARDHFTSARISLALLQDAQHARAHMIKVASYHLDDDPTVKAELAHIRSGAGHQDLIEDLTRLADLYDAHADTLVHDTRHYDPQDAPHARALRDAIQQELGAPPSGSWDDLAHRVWTLRHAHYNELLRAADFLYAHDPDLRALFVSLGPNASAPPRRV
jgi:hypothetical protein